MGIQHCPSGLQAHQSRAGISGDGFMITTNLPRRPWKGKTFNNEVFSMGFHDGLEDNPFLLVLGLIFKGEL